MLDADGNLLSLNFTPIQFIHLAKWIEHLLPYFRNPGVWTPGQCPGEMGVGRGGWRTAWLGTRAC